MKRMLLAIAIAAAAAAAQEVTLKVGDDAPPLSIAKWVKGEPFAFEKGKTYVVEFWATWCGPCLASMPHLSELQEAHAGKVTIVGVTRADPGNTLEAVERMVEARGPGMGYTVAWDDEGKTYAAYMTAAGQQGIPTSFVVGGDGKIAFIGHPMVLNVPLARVAAGTWDPVTGVAAAEADFARLQEILQMDRRLALDALPAFEKEHPEFSAFLAPQKFQLCLLAGRFEEASAVGRKLVEKAAKYRDIERLNEVGWTIVDPKTEMKTRDLDLALDAATKAGAIFALFWIETAGLDSKDVARQIQLSGMSIPGYRRNPQVQEKYLDRYIPRVTVIGGVFIGALSVFANLFGVIGSVSGTGLLLTVSITYRLYEEIASQQIMEMYPFMRTFFGKE